MIFQHFSHTNVGERKVDLAVKRSKVNLRPSLENNVVDLESPVLYTKIQPRSFGSGEEDIKVFYHTWARRPSCSVVGNHSKNIVSTLSTEGPM